MIKKLLKSVREYKKASILTPIIVSVEVIFECLIPFITANLIDYFNPTGGFRTFKILGIEIATVVEMQIGHIMTYAAVLVAMASIALVLGVLAGKFCATAAAEIGRAHV